MSVDLVPSGRDVGEDTKVIAVPIDKVFPAYSSTRDVNELPELTPGRIGHFFEHYKDLEKGKWVKVEGWKDAAAAKKEIVDGVKRFSQTPKTERPRF